MKTMIEKIMKRVVVAKVFLLALGLAASGCSKPDLPHDNGKDSLHIMHQDKKTAEEYYTCPMHPSVRSDRPGACPVCGMALVKKSAQTEPPAQELAGLHAVSLSPTQRVLANVSVVRAVRREFSRDISAVGIISYAEPNYRHISSRFPARLEKLYLAYTGQSVRKGDPVAEVYSPEAITAQQEFLLALDSYEQAQKGNQSFAAFAAELVEQSRQKLLQWGFTEKQIKQLTSTRTVAYTVTIYSPVSGIVVKKSVDPQHYVGIGEDMFDVADLSIVWIYLDVYEKDIRFVERGQRVQIKTEAYPYETFEGTVVFIDPVVNPETRTIRVRTECRNPSLKLKPNMYVTATILVPKIKALVVPSTAVLSTGKRDIVWVEVQKNTFEPREVMVGATRDGLTAILHGLDEGEHVVASGGFLLDSESALQQSGAATSHEGHGGSSKVSASGNHKAHSSTELSVQQHTIIVKEGYTPSVVHVRRGVPVRLRFERKEKSPCSDELVIEKLNIRRKLAAHASTLVEFTPNEAGEIPFTCGMAMLHGKIIVE